MLKFLGWMIKLSLLSAVILVLGNLIRWDGRTVSDQVRTQISHAERTDAGKAVKRGVDQIMEKTKGATPKSATPSDKIHSSAASSLSDEEITPSERQKLRALIRELNGSRTY